MMKSKLLNKLYLLKLDTSGMSDEERKGYKLALEKVTDKQFNAIIEEHGFFGADKKSRKQIAEERGCTLQNIGFLYRKAVNKVKDELKLDTTPRI